MDRITVVAALAAVGSPHLPTLLEFGGAKLLRRGEKGCRKAGQRRWQAVGQMESFWDGPVVVPTALLSPGPRLPRREARESAQRQRAVPVSARSEHFPAQFA